MKNRNWRSMVKWITAAALWGNVFLVMAAPVPVENVVAAARGWLAITEANPLGASLGNGLSFLAPAVDDSGATLYYAAYLEKGGVLVLSPDDAIEPVIAFSPDNGNLADPSPCNHLRLMLEADLADRLAAVKAGTVKDAAAKAGKWALLIAAATDPHGVKAGLSSVSDVRVAPLVPSRWSQNYVYQGSTKLAIYNYYTFPYTAGSYQNYYCGCVATALAQLMWFHKYPGKGVGTPSFTIQVNGVERTVKLRGGNGYGGRYDWANMPADPAGLAKAGKLSLTQRQAVGALCRDAGVASQMKYRSTGSTAALCWTKGWHPLQTTFLFKNVDSPWVGAYSSFLKKDINQAINPSLDARMPGALSINNNSGGHAVIVDGYGYAYGAVYHHLNMGWGGADTAWYNLPNVNAQAYSYFRVTGLLFNLNPWLANTCVISGRILNSSGKPVSGVRVVAKNTDGFYPNKSATSNAKGIFAIKVLPGSYKVTPLLSGYGFEPERKWLRTGNTVARNSWGNTYKRVTRIIRLSVSKLFFGGVPVGQAKHLKFTIANSGTASLSVSAIVCPPGFHVTYPLPPFSVPANGGKVAVKLTFAPVAAGYVKGDVVVKSNKSGGVNTLAVFGTGL